jgi:hypothetical protein
MMVGDSVATLDLVVPFGSVGIGTDSPSNPLHVYGIVDTPFEVKIENQGTLVNANVGVKLVTNTSGATWTADQDDIFLSADGDDTGTLSFRTQTASSYQTRMKISNVGDIGVGQAPVTGSKFSLPQEDFAGTPTLSFGDGDSGFYESADDILKISIGGTDRFAINTTSIYGITSGSAAILDEAASSTNPTVVPANNDSDTGIGRNSSDQLSLISGGVEMLRADSSAPDPAASQLIIAPAGIIGSATTPALAFGDGDSGFFESSDDILNIAIAGVNKWEITDNTLGSTLSTGPAILEETPSSTNPTFVPRKGDWDTGVGWNAADELSLVAGGVEGLRVAPDQVSLISEGQVVATVLGDVGLAVATDGYVNVKNNLYVDSRIVLHKQSGDPAGQSGHNKIYADGYNVLQVNQNSAVHTLSGSGVHTHRHDSAGNLDGNDRYYFPNQVSGHTVTSSTNSDQDRMWMVPFVTGEVVREIDRVGIYVAGIGTSLFVLGIYDSVSDTNLRPYNLIYNSTQHSSADATGLRSEITSIRLEPGKVYWTCFHADNTTTSLQVPHYYTVQTSAITGHPTTGTYQTGFYVSRTYNSTLPEYFGPATLIGVTTYVPQAMFRYSGY